MPELKNNNAAGDLVESRSNSCKNSISDAIRNALSTPNPALAPNINKSVELFDEIQNPLNSFIEAFEAAGGKCSVVQLIRTRMGDKKYALDILAQIYGLVKSEIVEGHYNTVLNGSPRLADVLTNHNISFVDSIPDGEFADAAIFYSEYLIARTGSIAFSQHSDLMLYPSVRNLAPNLIVVASSSGLVKDFQDVLRLSTQRIQEENKPEEVDLKTDMLELLHPNGITKQNATPANPNISLILLVEY